MIWTVVQIGLCKPHRLGARGVEGRGKQKSGTSTGQGDTELFPSFRQSEISGVFLRKQESWVLVSSLQSLDLNTSAH